MTPFAHVAPCPMLRVTIMMIFLKEMSYRLAGLYRLIIKSIKSDLNTACVSDMHEC